MGEVGIRALKQNASAVVAAAANGETITVTDRGRPVARMTPLPGSRLAGLLAAGLARPPLRPLSDLPDLTDRPFDASLSEDLARARADERY